MTTKAKLIHAVTEFDRKASKRKGYNPHALGIYFQRVDEVCADIDKGADVRKAICAGFSDRLLDHCLKALDLPLASRNEHCQSYIYQPLNK